MNLPPRVHFIGIGGIGISGLARIFLEFGLKVSGSDLFDSPSIKYLKNNKANIKIGKHRAENLGSDVELVVYTNAIQKNNPEYKAAQRKKIKLMSYPQCLGHLLRDYIPLVVSGTHGKSTTTAMLAKIFLSAGLDPSILVGTKIKECDNNNARLGLGRHFILEGDEYKEAFLNYSPVGLIINNIEADHLDYYKDESAVVKAFQKLSRKVPTGGFVIANADDANVMKSVRGVKCRLITFGLKHGDYQAMHIRRHGELTRFAVKGLENFDLALKVPGLHNVKNALAACVLALTFGVNLETIKKALLAYEGAWRRFEIKSEKGGVLFIDDYAHHPTEIRVTLAAARQLFAGRRIWCVFQPHSQDRTRKLFSDFVSAFGDCDWLVLTEIYHVAGRENTHAVSAESLYKEIKVHKKNCLYFKNYKTIPKILSKKLVSGDVVITMGAGNITEISDSYLK
jgi:UDP-N-acetylmuramate--alanine ligase